MNVVTPALEVYSIRPGPDGLARITARCLGEGVRRSCSCRSLKRRKRCSTNGPSFTTPARLLSVVGSSNDPRRRAKRCAVRPVGFAAASAWSSQRVSLERDVALGAHTASRWVGIPGIPRFTEARARFARLGRTFAISSPVAASSSRDGSGASHRFSPRPPERCGTRLDTSALDAEDSLFGSGESRGAERACYTVRSPRGSVARVCRDRVRARGRSRESRQGHSHSPAEDLHPRRTAAEVVHVDVVEATLRGTSGTPASYSLPERFSHASGNEAARQLGSRDPDRLYASIIAAPATRP